MSETITATEANREFSRILREVREGQTYVVTDHGRPVAKIVPTGEDDLAREEARRRLFERVRNQPFRNIGPWTRDELYEDEE
jgi:prevent-host-death family protein